LEYALANYCLLHLYWGGIGLYVLAKRWTGNNLASALAGMVFAFNGMTIGALQWPSIIAAQSWMPWVVWSVGLAVIRGGHWTVLAVVFGSLQMLTGGAENVLLTWIGVILLTWLGLKRPVIHFLRKIARFVFIVALISALAAIQLIPFFNFLQLSDRAYAIEEEQSPMPGWGWANLVLPLFNCITGRHGSTMFPDYCVMSSYYCGSLMILAGFGTLFMLQKKCVRWTFLLAVFCAIMALGNKGFLLPTIMDFAPQLNVSRYPIKYFFLGTFALSLLTACYIKIILGQNQQFKNNERRFSLCAGTIMYLAVVISLFFFQYLYPLNENVRGFFITFTLNTIIRIIVAAFTVLLLFKLTQTGSPHQRLFCTVLLITIVPLDLMTSTLRGTITVPARVYEPGLLDLKTPPVLGQGRLMVNHSSEMKLVRTPYDDPIIEMACKRKGMSGSLNLLEGYGKFVGNESLYFPQILEMYKWLDTRTNLGSLGDFCGIRYHTTPNDLFTWKERTNVMPFINIGVQPIFTNRVGAIIALYNEVYSLHDFAYLPEECRENIRAGQNKDAVIHNGKVERHRIEFDVSTPREALVTIAQCHYPAWRAKIGGTNATLYRANHAFQALEIPPGQHRVEVFYRDEGFLKGACLSFPVFIGLIISRMHSRYRGQV